MPSAVPAWPLPSRGKGETGSHRPLIAPCQHGMAQRDPKGRLGAPGEGPAVVRGCPFPFLQGEITAMSTGVVKESLILASGKDGRLYQGWHGAVGRCPAPLIHPVHPRQGLEPGQEPVVGLICPSHTSTASPTLEKFTFPQRQCQSCSRAQGSHPPLPFESPGIRI